MSPLYNYMGIDHFIKNRSIIRCRTIEEAELLLFNLHTAGYKWMDGESYIENNYWTLYEGFTCYVPFSGTFRDYIDVVMDGNWVSEFSNIKKYLPQTNYIGKNSIKNIINGKF